jgi:signal transduction histidine kinase
LRFALVDLDAVVLEAVGSARQLAHGQALMLERFEPVQLHGDEDRLKQLLLIVLDNALKYTPAGGTVTVALRRSVDSAELIVRDTGVGVAEDDLPHVFERFYRADPARGRDPGGTGLGLPIAQWIAQQHGGHIAIASRVGAGTTVTIHFPLADIQRTGAPATSRPLTIC